ncbi:MAG: hypothetical protein EOO14_02715 [Chitinophagaceae bacterium]|nr:MAG: hypothetical protein EOO14_02715 [Chitinophagaceae bacterium]
MKTLLIVFFALTGTAALSQQTIDVDKMDNLPMNSFYTIGGSPVLTARFVRLVSGSPYFSEKWMKVVALSPKGERYRSPKAKLDLFENQLYFLNNEEQEFTVTIPLKEIILTDTVTGSSYRFVQSSALPFSAGIKKGWYQVLAEGKAPLYKRYNKVLSENKPYGASTAEQTINTSEEVLLGYNNALHSIKRPKDVATILSDKKAALETYLQTEAAKKITQTDKIVSLVTYYNSLQ